MSGQIKQLLKAVALRALRSIKGYREISHIPAGTLCLEQLKGVKVSNFSRYPPVKRSAPGTIDKDIYWKFKNKLEETPQQTFVAEATGWRVWGNQGAVITDDDHLFGDVSREFENPGHSIFKQLKLVAPKPLAGITAVINASGASMYYHWMFDILPRIKLLNDAGFTFEKINHYVIDYREISFQDEALAAVGITKEKISIASEVFDYHIVAERLIVPSLPSRLDEVSADACAFLRDTFLKEEANSRFGRKLYLKRTGKREVINGAALERYLLDAGFEIIQCEQFTIKEQAAIFNNADILVGPHGAAFSNVVFCMPGAKVVELFSPKWINPCYWTICEQLSLSYFYLVGEGGPSDAISDAKGTNEDITVDLEKLKTLISTYKLFN
ncbi:MAG: Capsular polysaccharide biosynthesis protein [Mucilaginibacter sp.]|nr:Capsular polysaccharide biosynthesis protein [Mucilaginibacter sp.]